MAAIKIFPVLLFPLLLVGGCDTFNSNPKTVIVIQPFDDISKKQVQEVYLGLIPVYDTVIIRKSISLPSLAYTAPRNRYRADSLIRFLNQKIGRDSTLIGLTTKDISTTKGKHTDFGIMGLAFCPGNACVVSTFRLNKNKLPEQFYKVAIHELGHTAGLPHCREKTCYLRDAKGGNPLDEEIAFCKKCRSYLEGKGGSFDEAVLSRGSHKPRLILTYCIFVIRQTRYERHSRNR
jgi:archaemetzincin